MNTTIAKAAAIPGRDPVPDSWISLSGEVPEFRGEQWENEASAWYRHQAIMLADSLFAAIPGGTIDQLLAELCERMASKLRVRQGGVK
jgi:hypothetical protein